MQKHFHTIEVSDPRFEREHLRHVTVKSPALRARADLTVFVSPGVEAGQNPPIVILLHGVYGSHWAWTLKGGVHRTALRLVEEGSIAPLILAMPSDGLWGDGSGYLPHSGQDFERWIVAEVPGAVAAVLGQITPGSALFIAGLSMGGFAALRLGAKYPLLFRGVSGHSSITHFDQMGQFVEEDLNLYDIPEEDESLLEALLKNRDKLPPLRFDCGIDDPLIEHNRELHRRLETEGVPHVYQEFPGSHEWPYWEEHIVDTLLFFHQIGGGPSAV